MNRKTLVLFFLIALTALPAAAYTRQTECHGHWTRWQIPNLELFVPTVDFNLEWQNSITGAVTAWNQRAPGSKVRFLMRVVPDVGGGLGNNYNEIFIGHPLTSWQGKSWDLPAYTRHKWSSCNPLNPFDVAHYEEFDIILNPTSGTWDKNQWPTPADGMKNTTLIIQHELGHALGINHEDAVLATMNSGFPGPQGGPVGSINDIMPLADDVRGARAAYGTGTAAKDVTGSAVRLVSPGVSQVIPAPAAMHRNSQVSFPFVVHNLSTTDENVQVYFYMSPSRYTNPNTSFYLGQTTIALGAGRTASGTATLTVPANAPTGNQHFGWYVDPNNLINEWNDSNNGTALVGSTPINTNRVPTACFSASTLSGNTPLNVNFNAGCTSDADGTSGLTYTWDFGDGTTDSGPNVSHSYYYAGNFWVTLTVTDPSGAVSYTAKQISASCTAQWCMEEPQ